MRDHVDGYFDAYVGNEDVPPPRPNLWQPPAADDTPQPRRWRRWMLRGALSLLVIAATVAGVVYWQARSLVGEFQAGAKEAIAQSVTPELNVAPSKPTPGLGEAMTVLVVGSDRRPGENGQGRSDTMLLVRVDPDEHTASMMSIPRDLRVPIPGRGVDKINAAYTYGGARLLTATIREYFGVKIDHFFQVDFRGFGSLVSNLGGVYVPVDGRYFHVNDGTPQGNWGSIDLRPGYQRLGREDALNYVRFRHLDNDFFRAARQQIFLREVGRSVRAKQGSPTALPGLLRTIAKATTSDLKSVSTSMRIADTLRQIPPDRIRRVTLSANNAMYGGVYYLEATPQQKTSALRSWAHADTPKRKTPTRSTAKRKRSHSKLPELAALTPDGGRGRAIAQPLRGLERCAPTGLPAGFAWPARDAGHRYKLDGQPAAAMYATAGLGRSILWMWTTWARAPILDDPSFTVKIHGRRYEIWKDSGKVRQVAWKIGDTHAWVTNTLRNELSGGQMLALAAGCRPL